MAGISSYGAYIPYYRLSRAEIARAWDTPAPPGERAVANEDEDSITMAVEAGFDCLRGVDRDKVDGLFFASTTPPYREKQSAALVATVVDLNAQIRTADLTDSLRAGTNALRSALDAVKSGSSRKILVIAADCRPGVPYSESEQSFGDGAAALLITEDGAAVTIDDCYSLADEITDVWRTDQDNFVRAWEERWVLMHGYTNNMVAAVTAIMKRNALAPGAFAKAILFGPDPRSHQALARRLGFDAPQIQDTLFTTVGNTGAASALMMLVAALEEAKPGDRLLLASYGDGCDAFILTVNPGIEGISDHRGVKTHLASKALLPTYEKYLSFRRLVELPAQASLRLISSATIMWRTKNWVLRCHASKCRQCGMVTFPIQRVCYGCQAKDDYEEVRLSDRKGKLFTYSLDNLASAGINPPIVQSVVDFEDKARVYCVMTDCDPKEVKVDMPLELTFRRLHEGGDFHNYFWKCRPVREGGV